MKSLLARLIELERKFLPNPDQLLVEALCRATDGQPETRRELEEFLSSYDRGSCHLDEVALAFLHGPVKPPANPSGEVQ